jgi:hypothetical protein
MTTSDNGNQSPVRFPALPFVVAMVAIGCLVGLREVAVQTDMSGGAYWTGVIVFGCVAGVGLALFSPRFARWSQARKDAGKQAWWERLP